MSTSRGEHGLRSHAAVLYGLTVGRRSGRLEVRSGDHWRRLFIVAGRPVRYYSSLAEDDLEHSLVEAGLVVRKQVHWIQEHLGAADELGRELVNAGLVDEASLADHLRARLERGWTAALHWSGGSWSFDPVNHIPPDAIDPRLLGELSPLPALWAGVQQSLTMDEVLGDVTDREAGELRVTPDLLEWFDDFEVGSPLNELPGAIGAGASVEDIFKAIPDRTGGLVKLLWLLEALGLIRRDGRQEGESVALARSLMSWEQEPQPLPSVEEPAPPPTREPPDPAITSGRSRSGRRTAAPDPERLAATIRSEHARRMGSDYYDFVGVKSTASSQDIGRACARLVRRYGMLRKMASLPADVRAMSGELVSGATLVARTLRDETRRAEYDRRRARGKAPRLEAIRAADAEAIRPSTTPGRSVAPAVVTAGDPLSHVRELMAEGEWGPAAALLERLRRDRPSDPDVLAELGWATYRGSARRRADEADEYLRLALTFDANHLRATEALAHMAVDAGDADAARLRLRKLLSLQPDDKWARRRLSELEDSVSDPRSKGRGFRFWRKED